MAFSFFGRGVRGSQLGARGHSGGWGLGWAQTTARETPPECMKIHVLFCFFFPAVRVVGRWGRWLREVMGSPSTGMLKAQWDGRLRVALLDLEGSWPAPATCVVCAVG